MKYILARLQERSTWLGIGAGLAALGVHLTPDQWQGVAAIGTVAAGLAAGAIPTSKSG